MWQKQGESVSSKKVLVIKNFNPLKKTARLVELGEDDSDVYRYEGSNFPYGLWKEESDVSEVVIDAFAHIALQKLNFVKGIECFLVLSQFGITAANVVDDV